GGIVGLAVAASKLKGTVIGHTKEIFKIMNYLINESGGLNFPTIAVCQKNRDEITKTVCSKIDNLEKTVGRLERGFNTKIDVISTDLKQLTVIKIENLEKQVEQRIILESILKELKKEE
ncbi:unnamed protein product, partial [marine sediment metagenome]